MIGQPTMLACVSPKTGIVKTLPLFDSLRLMIDDFKPELVIIGNRVNIFGVNQNDDAQARQCLGILNSLIIGCKTTIIMPSHVSVRGMQSDGTSGSVQWSNGCRQRLLLKRPDEDETDSNARVLEVKKANWGPTGLQLPLHWDGVFVADAENIKKLSGAERVQREKNEKQKAEDEFMTMLSKAEARGINVSANPTARNNAATIFSETAGCKFKGKKGRSALAAAMDRLFEEKSICAVPYGAPSDKTYRVERVKK